MTIELFDAGREHPADAQSDAAQSDAAKLGQYPTPAWAAAALVREHLADLDADDLVLEPTCGPGRFLAAVPAHVPAIGVEIDPRLAERARQLTGRRVITGDILEVDVPGRPSVVLGNPPFETKLIERILDRMHDVMDSDGRVMFVLPAFFFQTARRVVRYSERWSMNQTIVPRNLYAGLKHPLVFATFRKDQQRTMIGFSLFHELAFLQELPKAVREDLDEGPLTWPAVVNSALDEHGGEASLTQIYEFVADRRPTRNPAWREQVRKVCQTHADRVGRARYAARRPEPASA